MKKSKEFLEKESESFNEGMRRNTDRIAHLREFTRKKFPSQKPTCFCLNNKEFSNDTQSISKNSSK